MADPRSRDLHADSRRSTIARRHGEAYRTPRWVKLFGIVALIVIALFVVSLLAGIRHGPGLHGASRDAGVPALTI